MSAFNVAVGALQIGGALFGSKVRPVIEPVKCTNFMSQDEAQKVALFLSSDSQALTKWSRITAQLLAKHKRPPGDIQRNTRDGQSIAGVWFFNVNGSTDCRHRGATEKAMLAQWPQLRGEAVAFANKPRSAKRGSDSFTRGEAKPSLGQRLKLANLFGGAVPIVVGVVGLGVLAFIAIKFK